MDPSWPSKALLEQLSEEDAQALGLSPERLRYTPLPDIHGASEKAKRDAGSVAVVDLGSVADEGESTG